MTSLAASFGVHGLLLAVALTISVNEGQKRGVLPPVRITYFKSPTVQLPSDAGVMIVAPVIASIPKKLPSRPVTAVPSAPRASSVSPSLIGGAAHPLGSAGEASGVVAGGVETVEDLSGGASGLEEEGVAPEQVQAGPKSIMPVSKDVPKKAETPPPRVEKNSGGAAPDSISSPQPEKEGTIAVAPVQPEATPTPRKTQPPKTIASLPQSTAPKTVTDGEFVMIGKGMPQARLTKKVVPRYPPMAKTQRVKGIVIVEVSVNERGRVVNASVKSSPSPLLNAEALSAAKKLRFAPYKLDGHTQKFKTRVPFRFDFR